MAAAVRLYEIGKLSSGAAAQLAGLPRTVFLGKLADYGVSNFRLTENELALETPICLESKDRQSLPTPRSPPKVAT